MGLDKRKHGGILTVKAGASSRQANNTRKTGSADSRLLQARPNNFLSWWAWGIDQAEVARPVPPLAIHSRAGDRDDWGATRQSVIRGLPFSRQFERHVDRETTPRFSRAFLDHIDGKTLKTPFTRAMSHLYSRRGRQTDEFKVVFALLSGETDPEIVRIVLLGSPHRAYFEETAIRALSFCWQRVSEQLAEAKDPPQKAGAA